jgi:hypothetical protein
MMQKMRGKREAVAQALADRLSMKMNTEALMRDWQAHFQARGSVIEQSH